MYRTCSLCLTAMELSECPMYALLQLLHFSSYIPLGLFWVGFSFNCWYVVFVARRAILRLDYLKNCLKNCLGHPRLFIGKRVNCKLLGVSISTFFNSREHAALTMTFHQRPYQEKNT
jgi:hypothetical protein